MIDRGMWLRLLLELHARNTEDDSDLTFAERRAVLHFSSIHARINEPRGGLSN